MNYEFKETRELKFVCPQCGGNLLGALTSGDLDIIHVYDNGVFTWGDLRPDEIRDYYCRGCGYEIEFGECDGLVEWLIAHCKQDESEAGQSPEDVTDAPPADES